MGLWDELECSLPPANPFHRAVRAAAARRPVSRALGVALHPLDRFVSGATQGRQSATQYVSGLPTITLVTVGARSGERRHTPLLAFPREGDIAVIGSNYGRERTPGWVHNVRANPEVEVEHAGRTVAAVAKRLGREAAAEVYEQAQREYPGYASYRTWAGGRDITVWLLVARDA